VRDGKTGDVTPQPAKFLTAFSGYEALMLSDAWNWSRRDACGVRHLDRSAAIRQLLLRQSFLLDLVHRKGASTQRSSTWKSTQALPSSTTTHCYDRTCFRHGDLFGRRHRYNKAEAGSVVVDIALPAT